MERYAICGTWDKCTRTGTYRKFWNVLDRWNTYEIDINDKYGPKTKVYSIFAENLERSVAQEIAQRMNEG